MSDKTLDPKTWQSLLAFQENEITEYHIYQRLAKRQKSTENARILEKIANEEHNHYEILKRYTGKEIQPGRFKVFWYSLLERLFGFTFAIRLMERGEESAQINYKEIFTDVPEAREIEKEENDHELQLIELLDEQRLQYVGSIVLGLNDALVELTGALAGLTLALQNTHLIALTGFITGVAASFSMAASEYLSTKSDQDGKNPLTAAVYTGIAYIVTVMILIAPYLLFDHYYVCLIMTLTLAIAIIAFFNYYISVAKDLSFKHRFFEMAGLSLGVAFLSFLIGFILRSTFGIEI